MLLLKAFGKALLMVAMVVSAVLAFIFGGQALFQLGMWAFPIAFVALVLVVLTYIYWWEMKTHSPNQR